MREELNFRSATAEDYEAVLELACQLATHIEAKRPVLTRERFAAYYLDAGAPMRLLLALCGDRVVGMIAWTLTHELYSGDARVYISDVSVDRDARGRGVGAALMNEVKAWARANHAEKLGWEVWHKNSSAKAFYQRMGATIDDEAIPYVLELKG